MDEFWTVALHIAATGLTLLVCAALYDEASRSGQWEGCRLCLRLATGLFCAFIIGGIWL